MKTFRECRIYAEQELRGELTDRPILRWLRVFVVSIFLYLAGRRWALWLQIGWLLICGIFDFVFLYPALVLWSVGTVLLRRIARLDPCAGKRWGSGMGP